MIEDGVLAFGVSVVLGYLFGSLPFAYFVARWAGVDIFAVGSGNPGASNVFRRIGARYGALVFGLDVSKGVMSVGVSVWLGCPSYLLPLAGSMAVVGHWFPLFLKFRGGAGLATALGVGCSLLGVWGFMVSLGVGLTALWVVRDAPRAGAVVMAVGVVIGLVSGPNYPALVGLGILVAMMLGRLFLVEFPRDRRGGRPG